MSEGRGQRGLQSIGTIAAQKKKEKKMFVTLPIDSEPLQGAEISKRKLTNKLLSDYPKNARRFHATFWLSHLDFSQQYLLGPGVNTN